MTYKRCQLLAVLTFFFAFSVLLFEVIGQKHQTTQELQMMIKSSFKWSPKIWGTYNLIHEEINSEGQTKSFKGQDLDFAHLIIEKGKFHLARAVETPQAKHSDFKLSSFPYKKNHKTKKFDVDINSDLVGLYSLYREVINGMVKDKLNKKIELAAVTFGKFSCHRSAGLLNCQVPVTLKI